MGERQENSSSMSEKRACGQRRAVAAAKHCKLWQGVEERENQQTLTLTDSLSEAEELRARAGPLLSDWLVRVERRVDWKLLLVKRSLPETQSSAPR